MGAHLVNAAALGIGEVFYWRDRNREVDFVVRAGRQLVAVEVKSGRRADALPGMSAFAAAFDTSRMLLVGPGGGRSKSSFRIRLSTGWPIRDSPPSGG